MPAQLATFIDVMGRQMEVNADKMDENMLEAGLWIPM